MPHMHTYKHLLVFTETLELPWRLSGKESARQYRRCGFHPRVWKIPWRREWQLLQHCCLRNPMDRGGYRLWGLKELDTI